MRRILFAICFLPLPASAQEIQSIESRYVNGLAQCTNIMTHAQFELEQAQAEIRRLKLKYESSDANGDGTKPKDK